MATKNPSLDCPTCGNGPFKNKHGLESHHSQVHGERLDILRTELECDWCGSEFEKVDSMVTDTNFCSKECLAEFRRETDYFSGENSPSWEGGPVEKQCDWCGDTFYVKNARSDTARFCGKGCYGNWLSENNVGKQHPRWTRVEIACSNCGSEITRVRHSVVGKEDVFCGSACRNEWLSVEWSGEANPLSNSKTITCDLCEKSFSRPISMINDGYNYCSKKCKYKSFERRYLGVGNPNYEGGPASRAGFTEKLKSKIRERDGFECQDCGQSQQAHIAEYGRRLSVHHIIPIKQFEHPEKAHHPDNLTTLCLPCHKKWEKMAGLKPQTNSD